MEPGEDFPAAVLDLIDDPRSLYLGPDTAQTIYVDGVQVWPNDVDALRACLARVMDGWHPFDRMWRQQHEYPEPMTEAEVAVMYPEPVLKPWPPSAAHYHGFDRAVIQWVEYEDGSGDFPVAMVDGVESHRARGQWDRRKKEWHDWWESDPARVSHSCRPAWRCILVSWAEVIVQAQAEGCEMPPWVTP